MEFRIREAAAADAEALARLLLEVHDPHAAALPHVFRPLGADDRPAELLRAQIAAADAQAFVAERAGEPVGYAWVRLHAAPDLPLFVPRRYAEVDTLVVAAAHRRRGVGRALVERAHRWAADQGVERVQLVVWEFNQAAIRFYERLGYATARRTLWRPLDERTDAP